MSRRRPLSHVITPALVSLLIALSVLLLGFPWYADLLAYPFRLLRAGTNQPYGTWTGVLRVEPKEIAKDTDRSHTEHGQHFAAAVVTVKPTKWRTFPGGWYFSHELVGTVLLHLASGIEQDCHFQLAYYDFKDHSLDAEIIRGDNAPDSNGRFSGTFVPGTLHVNPSTCPYAGTAQLSFNGDLSRGSRSDLPRLVIQLPARSAEFDEKERATANAFAGTWVGPASFWNSDHSPKPVTPNATLTLRITPTDVNSTERFRATGTVVLSKNDSRAILLRDVVLREGKFTSEGFFSDDPEPWTHNEEQSYFTLGSLDGRVEAGHLVVDHGGVMAYNVLANLNKSAAR